MKVDIEMSKERLVESIKSIQKQWDDLNAELNDNCSTGTAFLIKTIYIMLIAAAAIIVILGALLLQLGIIFVRCIVWTSMFALASYVTITTILPWFNIDLIAWFGQIL